MLGLFFRVGFLFLCWDFVFVLSHCFCVMSFFVICL